MEKNNLSEKDLYERGLKLMDDGKHDEALEIFEELAAQGNSDAMIYAGDIIMQKEIPELAKKGFEYYLTASKTSKWVWGRLCFCYANGVGTQKAYAEAVRYGNMVLEKNKEDEFLYAVYFSLGTCYAHGNGTRKDVSKGYRYLKIAEKNGFEEDAKLVLEELCSKYPFKEDGEIDLAIRKRSKLATLFIWMTILYNLGFSYVAWEYCHSLIFTIVSSLFFITALLLLLWKKWGAYMLLALPLVSIVTMVSGAYVEAKALAAFCLISGINNLTLVLLTLIFLQKRRKGYAVAWNSLMGKPDDGRNKFTKIFDFFFTYGVGPKFLPDSKETKWLKLACIILTLLLFVCSGLAAWAIKELEWNVNIEWNCFKSPKLYSALCVLGFFFQFFKGNWVHFSYKTYDVYLDDDGRPKKIKRHLDALDTIEGSFFWPLLSHLFFYPMIMGAIFYYVIMWGFSIIQGVMPYLLAVLVFLSAAFFFFISQKMLVRKYRIYLIGLITLCFVGSYRSILTNCDPNFSFPFGIFSTQNADSSDLPFKKIVKPTGGNVNLRMKPNVESPRLVRCMGDYGKPSLDWSDGPLESTQKPVKAELLHVVAEEGEWYKAIYCEEFVGADSVYVKKELCKDVKRTPLTSPAPEHMGEFYEIQDGKHKGMVLGWHWGWHGIGMSQAFQIGRKIDGGYHFTHDCSFIESYEENAENIKFEDLTSLVFNKKFFVMNNKKQNCLDLKQVGSSTEMMDYILSNLDKMSEIDRYYYGVEGDSDWHLYFVDE